MSFVGEATGVFGLLDKAWSLLRDWQDPARAQAKRLIETFEAYGIARQQITRILPPDLKLPNAIFSTPDKLKDKLTPELLDWAADFLVISRSWFDGVADKPHVIEDHYKTPAGYRDWLAKRLSVAPTATRFLYVWKSQGQAIRPHGAGHLCLVYEETADGLDGSEFTRYWLLSDHWSLHHAPCIENLLAVVAVANSLDISVLGHDIPMDSLQLLEAGKKLIPEVRSRARGMWHPQDLIKPLPGKDTDWRQGLWNGAQEYLRRDGIAIPDMQSAAGDANVRIC